jgi:hypothetical protein
MAAMKALDRSLVEKAGYDNGFEIVAGSDPSVVKLCSSLHPVGVDIVAEIMKALMFCGSRKI